MKNIENMSKGEINARFGKWRHEQGLELRRVVTSPHAKADEIERARAELTALYPVMGEVDPKKVPAFVQSLESNEA